MSPQRDRLWLAVKVFGLVAVVAAYFLLPDVKRNVNQLVFLLSMIDVYAVRGYVESAGVWAPLASIGLMVFQAVIAPLPAFIVTFANAALFGWAWGAVLSWTGAMLGAALCYWLARWYGRALVERLAPLDALRRFDALTERWGQWAVLVARLLPFVPFDPISYAAGAARMNFLAFLVATGVGQLPATIVYSLAGDLLAVNIKLLAASIAAVFVASALVFFFKRRSTVKEQSS
jgi:uncharacterized membrane protein YdjX (TVP38/TMEM64 family)